MPKHIVKKKRVKVRINKYYNKCSNYITNRNIDNRNIDNSDSNRNIDNSNSNNAMNNKYTNTDKDIKDYKLFVFDLDYTLYLHSTSKYADEYHLKIKNFLEYLKNNNKHLYIATHNLLPMKLLKKLQIEELFNGIIKETKDVNPRDHSVKDYTSKKDMLLEILNKIENQHYTNDDVIFFDDNPYNITEVNKIGIRSILVNESSGINLTEIY